jgi:putative ABC transport system substrate-binding protein
LGVKLDPFEVRAVHELESTFAAITRVGGDALFVLHDLLVFDHRTRIVDFALKNRLPAMFALREYVDAGGLLSYGVNLPVLWRRGALYVDKILKGAKPADLPVEQPMKFELVINLKTAQALGLTLPPWLLFQADEVIR